MHCVSEELRLKLTDRIFELTESKVRELGYELYDVEYQKEYDNWVLTLYIDSKDGISLDEALEKAKTDGFYQAVADYLASAKK